MHRFGRANMQIAQGDKDFPMELEIPGSEQLFENFPIKRSPVWHSAKNSKWPFKWPYLSHLWTEYGHVYIQITQNFKGYPMEGDRSRYDLV